MPVLQQRKMNVFNNNSVISAEDEKNLNMLRFEFLGKKKLKKQQQINKWCQGFKKNIITTYFKSIFIFCYLPTRLIYYSFFYLSVSKAQLQIILEDFVRIFVFFLNVFNFETLL